MIKIIAEIPAAPVIFIFIIIISAVSVIHTGIVAYRIRDAVYLPVNIQVSRIFPKNVHRRMLRRSGKPLVCVGGGTYGLYKKSR